MNLGTFIEEWLKSWSAKDPKKLLGYYADETYYSDPTKPEGISDKENLNLYFSKLLSKYPNWIWKAEEIFPVENGCILKWKAEIPVGKEIVVLFGLDIIEISDWKITRNEVYFDSISILEAIKGQNV